MCDSDVNPRWKLSYVPLNALNHILWSRVVTLSLGGKKILGFIDGKAVCPASTNSKYDDWVSSDQLFRSWVLNLMELQIDEIFTFFDSGKELWDYFEELYGTQNNTIRIFELKFEIAAATQGDKTFSEHLRNLKKMWDELNMY